MTRFCSVCVMLTVAGTAAGQWQQSSPYVGILPSIEQPPQRDFNDGLVQTGIWAFSANNSAALVGEADATSPGTTLLTDNLGSPLIEDVNVSISVFDVDATTRQVDVTWETTSGSAFIAPGSLLGSETIQFIAFSFGMDIFGSFPGVATNPFEDPDFVQVIGSTGETFDSGGVSTGVSNGALFTGDYPGGFGGRIFFLEIDGSGNPTGGDVTQFDYARYSTSIQYEIIPAPATAALFAAAGMSLVRRRR